MNIHVHTLFFDALPPFYPIDCKVTEVLKAYNVYPTQFKYLPKYKLELDGEFNITEETLFKPFEISEELEAYCKKKFPLKDCRNAVFKPVR